MQSMTDYGDIVEEVRSYFVQKISDLRKAGIEDIVIDPGFGFAKNLEQNYTLFKGMPQLKSDIAAFSGVERKLLVGISRKGMIWKPLGITPDEALCGTCAMNLQALLLGADILRVHDVAEAMQCVKLWECLQR